MGFYVHLLGIFGDSSFAARVYIKNTAWYRLASMILVSLYSLLWMGWLIWLHVVVFNHNGNVCRGHYLSDEERASVTTATIPSYALRQGQVLKNMVIGIWCANIFIALASVVVAVFAARYLK